MKKVLLGFLIIMLISAVFILPRLYSKEQKSIFVVGKISDFPKGTVQLIAPAKAFIISDNEGIYAISAVCTHKGCIIREGNWGLTCPCHAARFDLNGKVLKGPAKEDLVWYAVGSDEAGNLTLETSKIVPPGTKLHTEK